MAGRIETLFDQALTIKETHVRSGKYSPSSFGSCYRKQYWNRKDEPKTNLPDIKTERGFAAGHLYHELVQSKLVNGWEKEVLIEDEHFKGFADLVNYQESVVCDVKSQKESSFMYLDKVKDIFKEKRNNWLQVIWYAMRLNLKIANLTFVGRDEFNFREYEIEVNDYWKKEVLNEEKNLIEIWNKGVLPLAQEGWECRYCNWRDKCRQVEKGAK